jgi:predicted nucleic acid-binding protein
MPVLIDSSVWIEYFRQGSNANKVEMLLEEDLVVINDLVLAELVPFLRMKKQSRLIELLQSIHNPGMTIDWQRIIDLQCLCLENGLNGAGIPDLLIVDHAVQQKFTIYTLDKHFHRMAEFIDVNLGSGLNS